MNIITKDHYLGVRKNASGKKAPRRLPSPPKNISPPPLENIPSQKMLRRKIDSQKVGLLSFIAVEKEYIFLKNVFTKLMRLKYP